MRAAALALLCLLAAGATAQPLPLLQAWAREAAPQARLAALDLEVQQHRLQAAEAGGSARFVAGASLADAREAVTDTAVRDYRRGTVQAGVRWSLLAAAREREAASGDAHQALAAARLRGVQAQQQVAERVRTAYLDAHFAAQRAAYGEAFLRGEAAARRWLLRRTRAHLLLEPDRLAFAAMFDQALRERTRELGAHDDALRSLRRLTGHALDGFSSETPTADAACLTLDAALAGAAQRPAVALAAADVQARRERLQRAGALDIDAGLSLAQSVSRDIGGPGGRAAVVALDISVPLGAGGVRDAQRAQATAELSRAQLLLQERQLDDRAAVEQASDVLRLRRDDVASAARQFEAAWAGWRVASARAQQLDGDVLERELRARHALYQAAIADSQARQRELQARLVWLAYAPDGQCTIGASAPHGDDGGAAPPALQAALDGAAVAAAAQRQRRDDHWLGWYVWQADHWLDDAPWDALPPATGRLALSFTPALLEHLARAPQAERLRRLLDDAHRRGLAVQWLLGEASWVLPEARPRLLALLAPLASMPFDALHLDLERSQLPPDQQAAWHDRVLDTVADVRRVVSWPLVLTTHHREFADSRFVQRLHDTGLSEGVAMVYASSPERAEAVARSLVGGPLPLAVAQSIEPELPASESTARLGRRASLAQWQQLARQLGDSAGFDGIVVQSWEAFQRASP